MKARLWTLAGLALGGSTACAAAEEAKRVELVVVTDGEGLEPVTTNLGYHVELSSAALVAEDLKLAIAGEAPTSLWHRISSALVPLAHAHPGHDHGGEITGELPGHFVLRFAPETTHDVGTATLLVGEYSSVSLTLAHASEADVAIEDPLLGHSAWVTGTASRDEGVIEFEVVVDSPEGRELVGIPFEVEVTESTRDALVLRLLTRDPNENDTLFDGLDFALLDFDGDAKVTIDAAATDASTTAAYNLFRRTLQTHDHFVVQVRR